jgi:primary-amine oxidase
MTVAKIGFQLVPDGFFDGNPALDLPRPSHNGHGRGS